ncbi:MAG: YIP1 family protein [Methanomicrobiales archaeon]|nr:YIP1 family protein [Methanomicrobiales archaeon]
MATSPLTMLVNPNAFFGRNPTEWEALRIPALIMLAAAVVAGAMAYLTTGLVARIMPADVQAYQGVMLIAGTASALIFTFLIWAVWAAVFFVISLAFQGKGSFRRTLAVTGYGYLPMVIGNLLSLALLWVALPGIRVTPVSGMDPGEIQAVTTALMHQPALLLAGLLGIIFLLWAANIWIFGIRYARGLSLRHAAITVGIPVGLFILMTVWNLGVFT